MKIIKLVILGVFFFSCTKEKITIVIAADATKTEKQAATIVKDYCEKIYNNASFSIDTVSGKNKSVRIGLKNRFPEISCCNEPESFCVSHDSLSITIAAHDDRGLLYAVYAQLEKLGCGFYLSMETLPVKKKDFLISEWELLDKPMMGKRIVFNWHNFLSGCTSWNWNEWKQWVLQSSKMRFNTIMVHAYGNNPMFRFSHNGIKKESGYIAASNRGRDWGTEHVNDVRNLWGGSVFDGPVFGAAVARVPEEQKEDSAVALMQRVFDYAREQQMNVCFAFDIATNSSNPQTILKSLPEPAVIKNIYGDLLVNPESPDGYAYLKSQVQCIFNDYPQITALVPWTRLHVANPVGNYQTPAVFPKEWKKDYEAVLQSHKLDKNGYIQSIFYISKVMKAYRSILDEMGKQDVELSIGTWNWDGFLPMDKILPKNVSFIPIDWSVNFDSEKTLDLLRKIDKQRTLIPIVWAHHDDHKYIGKPYTPYEKFVDLLKERNAAGFGIIHWTTRPLDIYFKSLSKQVWQASLNEPLQTTAARMAKDIFANDNADLGNYLYQWITTAPMMGRETTDFFFDFHKTSFGDTLLHDAKYDLPDTAILLAKGRIELLKKINPSQLTKQAKDQFNYYNGMEEFFTQFFSDQKNLIEAFELCEKGRFDEAKKVIANAHPEKTIEKYAEFSNRGSITEGEKGVLLSLNTKWLPDFIDIRQQTGMEPYRYKFYPTQHEPLAQGEGNYSFYFNSKKEMSLCKGQKELKLPIITEGINSFIQSDTTFSIELTRYRMRYGWASYTSAFKDDSIDAGTYKINLIFVKQEKPNVKIEFFTHDHQKVQSTKLNEMEYEFILNKKEKPIMTITPQGSTVRLSELIFNKQ